MYPFPTKKFNNSADYFGERIFNYCISCEWNGLQFYLGHIDNSAAYIIADGDNIISGFIGERTDYQSGDFVTECFTNRNGDLIINNDGNVSSMVMIRKSLGG